MSVTGRRARSDATAKQNTKTKKMDTTCGVGDEKKKKRESNGQKETRTGTGVSWDRVLKWSHAHWPRGRGRSG